MENNKIKALEEWKEKTNIPPDMEVLAKIKVMIDSYSYEVSNNRLFFDIAREIKNIEKEKTENIKEIKKIITNYLAGIGAKIISNAIENEEDSNLISGEAIKKINEFLESIKIPSNYIVITQLMFEKNPYYDKNDFMDYYNDDYEDEAFIDYYEDEDKFVDLGSE